MATDYPTWSDRTPPEFVERWRSRFGAPASLTTVDFLDSEEAYPSVVAASWLFCPDTVEYRGGVFLTDAVPAAADRWIEHFDGEVVRGEQMANRTVLFDVFTNVDTDAHGERALCQLAAALGECWQGVLARRHPDLGIVVTLTDEPDGDYGPTLTFRHTVDRDEPEGAR